MHSEGELTGRENELRGDLAECVAEDARHRRDVAEIRRAVSAALDAPRTHYGVIDPFMAQSALEEIRRIVGR